MTNDITLVHLAYVIQAGFSEQFSVIYKKIMDCFPTWQTRTYKSILKKTLLCHKIRGLMDRVQQKETCT